MKRYSSIAFLSVLLPSLLTANPSAIYLNPGVVNQPTNIDAVVFDNQGQFNVSGITSGTNFALSDTLAVLTAIPFTTKDTLNYTNSGTMIGAPGYNFETITGTTIGSAASLYNDNLIEGVDTAAFPEIIVNGAGTAAITVPAYSQPLPSIINVLATNIVNQGSLVAGNAGKVVLTGQNVNLMNGFVRAGTVSEVDPIDTTGNVEFYGETATTTTEYYTEPPTIYDLSWGVTNAVMINLLGLVNINPEGGYFVDFPFPPVMSRGGIGLLGGEGLGLFNEFTNLTAYAYESFGLSTTDIYYTVVFLNTNFANSNITANVRFSQGFVPINSILGAKTEDPYGVGVMVEFTEPVVDLSTGLTVSNSIYLLDSGSETTNNYSVAINAAYVNGYGRPDRLSISLAQPEEWAFGLPANVAFDPTMLYTPQGEFANQTVAMNDGAYSAQIGVDPEVLSGLDPLTSESSLLGEEDITAPTSDPARIEINAQNLNLTTTRLQANGVVTLNASNLVGIPYGTDWGNVNSSLGSGTNSALMVSNLFPTTFNRLRGDLEVWAGSWLNTQTNEFLGATNVPSVTNSIHYHVVYVNQDLKGTFISTILNLSLRSTNVVAQDTLRVINNVLIGATNLTLNNTNIFTQNAGSITLTNLPGLQNLLINSNASVAVDNEFDVGYNINVGTGTPESRKYSVSSVTNLGSISSSVALFECSNFESDGSILADNGGAIIIAAANLGLGLALTNANNSLTADGDVTLSANTIIVTNSTISSGNGGLGSIILDVSPSGVLSDLVSGAPGTNQHLVNQWQTRSGFSLLEKPAAGDLFGTEITSIATGFSVANHVWAGADYSNNIALGFSNNAVIGHLKLSRQSPTAAMVFSGAGTRNGMYVDYLELDSTSYSYSDYREGMTIDPNLTIYFADSNVDPFKLENAYPGRIVWVPGFSGPNSTAAVPYKNSSSFCLMNAALADSQDISFFPGEPPNFFNQPYVLNDPTNSVNTYPCPGIEESGKTFLLVSHSAVSSNIAMISVNGNGTISPIPAELTPGKNYTLTAVAASGWVFSGWQTTGLTENSSVTPAGLAGSQKISGNVLKFSPSASITIVANFMPNSFTPWQGVYNGLFYNTNDVNPGSSGFFSLTLRPNGGFSGHVSMGPDTYSFSSTFPSGGSNQVEAQFSGKTPLTLNLQLQTNNGAPTISGQVSQTGWSASSQLWAELASALTGKNHSTWAGKFTAYLPGRAGALFMGDGYASITVSESGLLSAIGGLPDGTAFSQSVQLPQDGMWPLYAYVPTAKDMILGWVTVATNGPASTNLTWSKLSQNGQYAFTNLLQMAGSPYNEKLPLDLSKPVVILSGGGVDDLTNTVSVDHSLSYTSSVVTLRIQGFAGTFTGWINNGDKRETAAGVVLQNTNSARGYFLDGNAGSGSVLLQNQ